MTELCQEVVGGGEEVGGNCIMDSWKSRMSFYRPVGMTAAVYKEPTLIPSLQRR